MKRIMIIAFTIIFQFTDSGYAQVAINSSGGMPDASAMLDIQSTDKGLLIPRMTAAERDNIVSPAEGLMVYVTDLHGFWYYDGNAWVIASADNLGNHTATENIKTNGHFISNDGDPEGIFIKTDGNVIIGDTATTVSAMLHLKGDDPDINLNMNSSSTVANMIELRFSTDDTIRADIYYRKDNKNLYFVEDIHHEDEGNIIFMNNHASHALMIQNNGKIGINTDTAQVQLTVNGNILHGNTLYIYSNVSRGYQPWVKFTSPDNGYGDNIFLGAGNATVIGSGESSTTIKNNIDTSNYHEVLYLGSDREDDNVAIKFITGLQNGWDNRVEAVTILGDGRVGIGTDYPYGTLDLEYTNDAGPNGSSNPGGTLNIGDVEDLHLELDNNEIHAMSDSDNPSTLYLNNDGGRVTIGQMLKLKPQDEAPDNPEEGDIYYDSNEHKIAVYTDEGWKYLQFE